MKITLLIVLAILILAGCICTQKNQCNTTKDSTMITTKVGEEFNITLDSNPTTGYQWKLLGGFKWDVVEPGDAEYVATETQRIGAGGKDNWTFKAVGPGETTMTFEYFRPWEKGVDPVERVNYRVVVE